MSNPEEDSFCTKSKERSDTSAVKGTEGQDEKYNPLYFCRTCANKDSCFVSIFKGDGMNHHLHQKIKKYLPIHVTRDDDLPLQLCYNCASTIIAWDTLVIGCIDAEKKLKSLKNRSHDYDHENKKNEKPDQLHEAANNVIDSDDEPLMTKKLSIIKNSKKRRNSKKQVAEGKAETPELHQENENEADRRSKSIHRCSVKSVLANENEILDNSRSVNDGDSSDRIPGTDVEIFERKLTENETEHHCPVCFKTFSAATSFCEDLYSHLGDKPGVHVDEDKFKNCRICKEPLSRIRELLHHLLLHIDSKRTKTPKDRSFTGRKRRKKKKGQIDESPFKSTCEICGKMISKKYTMKRHLITHSGEKRYTCHHCGKQYAQESGLQRHMSVIHEGIRKYKCPICSQIFGTNFELKTHQYTHTDPKPFQCDQCGRMFVCQKHLYHHRKYHHTANGLRRLCKICNKYFSSPGVLKRHHKVIHLGLKEFQCHVCSAQLSTKQYLQEHLKIHTDERPEVCSYCGKTFQMTGNLRQHLKIHMEKTQICHVCGKGFTRRCHLLTHMGSHKNIELPQCQYCQKRFILKIDLEKHLKSDHDSKTGERNSCGYKKSNFKETSTILSDTDQEEKNFGKGEPPEALKEVTNPKTDLEEDNLGVNNSGGQEATPKTWLDGLSCKHCGEVSCTSNHEENSEQKKTRGKNFECNLCQQRFMKKMNLEKHIKKHEREKVDDSDKRFTCGVCNKKFKFEDNGLSHEKLCGKEDSTFKCSVCGKRFETKNLAEQHSTSHHKSCVCHMCGQSFNKPESLKQHIKTVHEEFKMVCHYCGREFTRKARLQEHLQHHTGQMDFTCHVCGKGSTNAYSFSVHLATHTQETPFSCSFCPRTFKHMKYVYLHERAVHLKLKSGKTYIKPKKPGKNVAQRTCPLCNKTFKRESAMLIHKRMVHEGKNGYICKLCGKDFKYTYLLYVHRKKHHFPELCKYVCQFCEKPFPVKTELEKHLRKHTGEKPYICGVCGKTYSFHGSLNMHIRTQHENNKNFKCESCDASFNFRSHLTRHMSAHAVKFPLDFGRT